MMLVLTVTGLGSGGRPEARHGEAAERQDVVAVTLFDLQHLVDRTHGEDVSSQGVVDASDEAGHALASPMIRGEYIIQRNAQVGLFQPPRGGPVAAAVVRSRS